MYDVLNDWLCKGLLKNKTEVRLDVNQLLFVYLNSVGLLEVVVSKKQLQTSKSSSKLKKHPKQRIHKTYFPIVLPSFFPSNSFRPLLSSALRCPFYPFDNLTLHFCSPISFFFFCLFIFSFLSKFMHFLYLCQRAPPPPPPDTHTNSTKTASPLATLARSQNEQAC